MKYGLLGEKLSHSFSPQIHKMLGNDDYGLFSVAPEELESFVRAADFSGINVTIPYKKKIIPYLSEISEKAREIGSVNTVVKNGDGSLSGFNTDYYGLGYMLEKNGIRLSGRKVIILGNGGTSLTARVVARDMGAAEIKVISRNGEDNYENILKHRDAQVIINTTPVGMYPENGKKLVSLSDFPECEAVADVIYNPFYTGLLLEARERGIKYTNGLLMLVAQAKAASDIFFSGRDFDKISEEADGVIEKIHRSLFGEFCNICLTGMPSSGKTSVGKELASLLGKRFADTDSEIVRRSGMTVPEIFEREGEEGFRKREAEVIKELGKERGLVIATGGGAVLREENRRALKQNSAVVFIERDTEKLSLSGRPLSKSREELYRMYEKRLPIYESFADIRVTNDKTIRAAAEKIKEEAEKYEITGYKRA